MKLIRNTLLAVIASIVASSSLAKDHSSAVARKLRPKSGSSKGCSDSVAEQILVSALIYDVANRIHKVFGDEYVDGIPVSERLLYTLGVKTEERKQALTDAVTDADEDGDGKLEPVELAQVIAFSLGNGDCVTVDDVSSFIIPNNYDDYIK